LFVFLATYRSFRTAFKRMLGMRTNEASGMSALTSSS
jgi:hypothetical protein